MASSILFELEYLNNSSAKNLGREQPIKKQQQRDEFE